MTEIRSTAAGALREFVDEDENIEEYRVLG